MKSTQKVAPLKARPDSPSSGASAPGSRGNEFAQDRLKGQANKGQAESQSLLATPGRALPRLGALEARFGTDLSTVRVHDGPEANGIVRGMGAFGVTFGDHIGFAAQSPDNDLLMHELAHVLQQRGGPTTGEAEDERGAEAVERGQGPANGFPAPRIGGKASVRYKLPTNAVSSAELQDLGNDKIDAKSASAMDGKRVAAAIAYNNRKWTGNRRVQLRTYLGAVPDQAGKDFTESEVKQVQSIQLGAGIAADKADGIVGDTTMEILLESGFSFNFNGTGNVDAKDVTLSFYPGEFEDLGAWTAAIAKAKEEHPEDPYRHVKMPTGTGRIYVKHKGNVVAVMNARGGPALTLKDGDHTADPTKKGSWKLGKGRAHVTAAWEASQIPWGAQVRARSDGEWEFQVPSSKKWRLATGSSSKLKHPLSVSDFTDYNQNRSTWEVNDFGKEAFRINGADGQFLHTSPKDEETVLAQGTPVLSTSHGCVHLNPAERDEMSRLGFLQGGVTLVVKAYHQHALPKEMRKMMER